MTKQVRQTKIEKYGFSTFVVNRVLVGTSIQDVTRELNVLAKDRRMDISFTRQCVTSFLQRCGLAYSIYQQDLVKKTLEPIIDVVQEAANSVIRLVKVAEEAENEKEVKTLVTVSKELHNGLRLLAEMQRKLEPPEIHITQVNALIMGIADKIEHADDIPLPHRRSFLRLLAEALPAVGQLATGAPHAKKALAEQTSNTRNVRGAEK